MKFEEVQAKAELGLMYQHIVKSVQNEISAAHVSVEHCWTATHAGCSTFVQAVAASSLWYPAGAGMSE